MSYHPYPERDGYHLAPWAENAHDDWSAIGGCSCHISPPCYWCLHEGHPGRLLDDPDAWEPDGLDLDAMEADAKASVQEGIEAAAHRHLAEMKGGA